MGILRGGLLVVACVLLFVVFLAGNVLWTLDKSLDYDTIKPKLVSSVKEVIEDQINVSEVVGDEFAVMEEYCLSNPEYVFSHDESGRVFEIECGVVAQGQDAVVDYAIEGFVEEIYTGQVEETRFDFASLKEKTSSYFYVALVAALILFVAIFFLVEIKSNAFIVAGSLLIVSALPFAKIESFFSFVPFEFIEYLGVFFSEAYSVFLTGLIVGLLVLGFGMVMKFFGVGFKLFDFMNKFNDKKKSKVVVKEKVVSGKNK